MNLADAIAYLEKQAENSSEGLPEELFEFISRLTPIVNIDLLVHDEKGRTLLSWRDDVYNGVGWHVPGGIVRFKEKFEERVVKVAELEFGTKIEFDPIPVALNQVICKKNTRGHFVSILYKGNLPSAFVPNNEGRLSKDNGYLIWHETCPENLIKVHEMYRSHIENKQV